MESKVETTTQSMSAHIYRCTYEQEGSPYSQLNKNNKLDDPKGVCVDLVHLLYMKCRIRVILILACVL